MEKNNNAKDHVFQTEFKTTEKEMVLVTEDIYLIFLMSSLSVNNVYKYIYLFPKKSKQNFDLINHCI